MVIVSVTIDTKTKQNKNIFINKYAGVTKKPADDIKIWGQFHQHFISSFSANYLAPKKYKP
jgi:hypothetical protein